jgi:hypothetical protein
MTTQSDLRIPRVTDILDRALDIRESAVRLGDEQAVRQIDRLCQQLPQARLCWVLGVLHVASPSGNTYHVTRAGCDCLNARKCGKRACWHWALLNVLIDMFETECETSDMQCDPPGENPLGDDEGDSLPSYRPMGCRIASARSAYAYL